MTINEIIETLKGFSTFISILLSAISLYSTLF